MKITKYAADMSNVLGNYYVPDHDLEPPEYDDPEEVVEKGSIYLTFEHVAIEIDEKGNWTYEDDTYAWAYGEGRRGKWQVRDVNVDLTIDPVTVVEYIDSVIEPMMPTDPGKYYISGEAELVFNVTYDMYDDEPYEDSIDYNLDYQASDVTNFTCKRY